MPTPAEHFAEAERLLARVDEMEPTLSISRCLVARAQVHATLAQCPEPYDYDGGYVSFRPLETRETTGDRL